jgi:hypothetical protein
MKSTFFEHVVLAMAAGALVLPSCGSDSTPVPIDSSAASSGGGEVTPPIVVAAEFVSDRQIRVRFSEGVSNVSQVDPTQFRLSLTNVAQSDDACYDYYYYTYAARSGPEYQPLDSGGPYYYYYNGCEEYYTYYRDAGFYTQGAQNPFVSVANDTTETAILLDLGAPFDPALCGLADGYTASDSRGGLLLHFSSSGSAITDQQGNELGALGAAWVTHPNAHMGKFRGILPNMLSSVRIPCAF